MTSVSRHISREKCNQRARNRVRCTVNQPDCWTAANLSFAPVAALDNLVLLALRLNSNPRSRETFARHVNIASSRRCGVVVSRQRRSCKKVRIDHEYKLRSDIEPSV
jgi:hypothetical protein